MGCVCCCLHVADPGNSSNSSNTSKCPNSFLLTFFNKFAAITFNEYQTPANQNNGAVTSASNDVASDQTLPDPPHKDLEVIGSSDHNYQEHVKLNSVELTECSYKVESLDYESSEDEDICPTCLEGYTPENPKMVTKCCHHYHLSCIYEWMERSSTCPVCSKAMIFDETA